MLWSFVLKTHSVDKSEAVETGPSQPAMEGWSGFSTHHALLHFCAFGHEPALAWNISLPHQEPTSTSDSLKQRKLLAYSMIPRLTVYTLYIPSL